jgi:hydrophobe/amphiphile efflux-1 (HAE1) family protein
MSKFFITRPIFAWVIAIIIMLSGVISLLKMPVEQYPSIAPPSVSISTTLPGASAETLESSVTQVIEQSLTGIDNLRYFSSSSDSDGNVSINITFEPKTNPDIAQMQVQNKLQAAMPMLPQEVQQQGVRVNKSNNNFLLVVALYSQDGKLSEEELGDILLSNMKDQISRINGVGNVNVFGKPRAMRIWLNPRKLFSYNLTTADVISAIKVQNTDVSAGQLGGLPAVEGQQLNATITAQSRLQTVEQFKNIVLKVSTNGGKVYLKDVAKVELGAQSYSSSSNYKGKPASGMAIVLASGANALTTADQVKKKVEELTKALPNGVKVVYPYDSTPFVKQSIKSVVKTLFEAIILVFIVMFLFLQNFRATLIPTIAVPVVLLGTCTSLYAFGFTLNTLTMFAMVLAIGLLVDDAIVVVENVERIMHEEDLSPVEATKKSMEQITGALVGIALVLSAVFVPMAFFGGSSGAIYRQFSITIVSSMVLSVFVALILSPSLCATILKKTDTSAHSGKFITLFNNFIAKSTNFYVISSNFLIQRAVRFFVLYLIIIGAIIFAFAKIPKSFLPVEDQGFMYMMLTSPSGATLERTAKNLKKVEEYFLKQENVEKFFTVTGFSFAGRGQNVAFGFVGLKDWSQRHGEENSIMAISTRANKELASIQDASIFTFFPPPIRELGNASGFDLQLVDLDGLGHQALIDARNQVLGMAAKNPLLAGVRPNGLNDVAQFKIDVNYHKAMSLGLSIADVNQTLQTALGSSYVNDFLDKKRIKRVFVQAEAPYRMLPSDINKWYVRNKDGKMVSFASFSSAKWVYGSPKLERFNGLSSVNIQGGAASGVSSGVAMKEIQKIVETLQNSVGKGIGKGIGYAWSGVSYEEKSSHSQTLWLYAISLLVVFLCLAALYESWLVPFAVILVIPFGIAGSVLFAALFKLSNDVYFQVGLLTIIGLSAKNAILIIEFAQTACKNGSGVVGASLEAVKLRFRPIIMTSMAFMLGILPLAFATGAGSVSQRAIGIGVIGGVFVSTFIATFFVSMFYVSVQKIFVKSNPEETKPESEIEKSKSISENV